MYTNRVVLLLLHDTSTDTINKGISFLLNETNRDILFYPMNLAMVYFFMEPG